MNRLTDVRPVRPGAGTAPSTIPALVLLLLMGGATAAEESPGAERSKRDWPVFRGDSGLSGVAPPTLADNLTPRWVFAAGEEGIESAATVQGDTVFVATLDGRLHAVSLSTGKALWTYTIEAEIRSSPSVDDGVVYFGDGDGTFHAVGIKTGKARWTFKAEAEIVSSANFADGRVIFGSHDQSLYALSPADGSLVWRVETDGYVYGTPAIAGNRVVSAGCDGFLRIVDARDGSGIKTIELGAYVGASPALRDGNAYVGTFGNQVLAVALDEGRVLWSYENPTRKFPFFSSAAVGDELVVVGGRDKLLHAIDRKNGESRWTFNTGGRVDSSPIIVGPRVYVGAGGEVLALDLESGDVVWRFETGSQIVASPTVSDGNLLIGTTEGRLFCFGGKRSG